MWNRGLVLETFITVKCATANPYSKHCFSGPERVDQPPVIL
jgi:hypothetical protein